MGILTLQTKGLCNPKINLVEEVDKELALQEELNMLPAGFNSQWFKDEVLERMVIALSAPMSYTTDKSQEEVQSALQKAIADAMTAYFKGWR